MATKTAQTSDAGTDLVLSTAVIEQFQHMVTMIPDADEGGISNILAQIFAATTAEDLEKPWSDNERNIPLGRAFTLLAVSKRASDFRDGLGFYLECDVVDLSTGEQTVWITGSVSAVAQIVKAVSLDLLPLNMVLVEADKPSKDGYRPQHLEVLKDESKPVGKSRRG